MTGDGPRTVVPRGAWSGSLRSGRLQPGICRAGCANLCAVAAATVAGGPVEQAGAGRQ